LALRSVLSNADVRWIPFEAIVEHLTLVGLLLVARAPGSSPARNRTSSIEL
jgi:hypothetical protein